MDISLRISLIVFGLVLIYVTTKALKKGRMPIKYSLLWYFCSIIVLLVSIFPITIEFIANLFGFQTLSNLIIAIVITLLLFLTMSLTIITAGQNKKIIMLIQEVSMLKSRLDGKDEK